MPRGAAVAVGGCYLEACPPPPTLLLAGVKTGEWLSAVAVDAATAVAAAAAAAALGCHLQTTKTVAPFPQRGAVI